MPNTSDVHNKSRLPVFRPLPPPGNLTVSHRKADFSPSSSKSTQEQARMSKYPVLECRERMLDEQALKASHGNEWDAARRLGIHRRLLYEKLTQFGMV
jgi:DNA-binding NtrC family response regulator